MVGLSEVLGQDRALSFLENSMKQNRISHAYLFMGPPGVGKMLTAQNFAWQLIACYDEDAHIFWKDRIHPDILNIEVQKDKTVITKEQITKEVEPWLALKPYRAKHRVVIIRDVHFISNEAANSLLKTLEEPPSYAVIILVSDQNELLETITSRCQIIKFFPIPDLVIEQYLIKQGVNADLAKEISKIARGSISLAKRFVEDKNLREKWQIARNLIAKLNGQDISQVFNVSETIDSDTELFTNMLETILRDILVYKTTGKEELVIVKDNLLLADEIRDIKVSNLTNVINNIDDLKRNYRRHVNSMLISVNIARAIWQAFH